MKNFKHAQKRNSIMNARVSITQFQQLLALLSFCSISVYPAFSWFLEYF